MAKKILVIEDEVGAIKVLTKLLTAGGFEVVSVWDGGLAVNEAVNQKPDLVLLDLMLPGKGGVSVLEELQSRDETKNIPVIILSSLKREEYKKIAEKPSVKAYLTKPYDAKELMGTIQKVLGG